MCSCSLVSSLASKMRRSSSRIVPKTSRVPRNRRGRLEADHRYIACCDAAKLLLTRARFCRQEPFESKPVDGDRAGGQRRGNRTWPGNGHNRDVALKSRPNELKSRVRQQRRTGIRHQCNINARLELVDDLTTRRILVEIIEVP